MKNSYKQMRDSDARSWRGGIAGHLEETLRLIRTTTTGYQLVIQPLMLGIALALGISLALVYSAQSQALIAAVRIDDTANDVAAIFISTIRSAVIPVYVGRGLALANQNNISAILPQYNSVIAQDALDASQGACAVIGIAPNGRVLVQYPLKGNEKSIGHDLFRNTDQFGIYQGVKFQYPNRHADSLRLVAQRDVVLTEPSQLVQGYKGLFARLAVFVKGVNRNETFGQQVGISDCDIECYDSTKREKVWGVISGILRWDNIAPVFTQKLASYRYRVSSGSTIILQSVDPVTGAQFDGITAKDMSVFNLRWRLTVEPKASTLVPEWRDPVIAVTCFAALVVSLMIQLILVQKKQRRRLLLDILPKYALTALENGLDPSKDFDCACILFTDIVDFTVLCSTYSPRDITVLLHELYSLFDRLADAHSVFKIETIGDSFVCCTGCPYPGNSREKDAANLALFAIDLLKSVSSFQSSNGIKMEVRIGLHCGPVIGTIMGKKCPRFCLVGDTINVTSRMESTSEAMKIHCSSAIAQLLQQQSEEDALLLERRGVMPIKGKGQMETYWLRARDGDAIFIDSLIEAE